MVVLGNRPISVRWKRRKIELGQAAMAESP